MGERELSSQLLSATSFDPDQDCGHMIKFCFYYIPNGSNIIISSWVVGVPPMSFVKGLSKRIS
jgi:hypothetical protein